MENTKKAPVSPTPVGKLPRIIAANCEFCGVNASRCAHTEAFRAAGVLQKSAAMKDDDKIYQNFNGLPRVIAKICEFCGVDAKICAHGAERRQRALTAQAPSLTRVERDRISGAKIFIKEPANKEVTEKKLTEDEYNTMAATRNANAAMAAAPAVTDQQVAGSLKESISNNEGVGMDDDSADVDL